MTLQAKLPCIYDNAITPQQQVGWFDRVVNIAVQILLTSAVAVVPELVPLQALPQPKRMDAGAYVVVKIIVLSNV